MEERLEQRVVSHEEWLTARQELLEKEKAFTRQREELSRLQRDLPWEQQEPKAREREGHSIFYKNDQSEIFHAYSCYDRGNDQLNIHYHYLDLVPKGRDEGGRGPYWVRRRDEYDH
jgi:predicted dithiol-disulfide oxidoreductase (DUF899 family)